MSTEPLKVLCTWAPPGGLERISRCLENIEVVFAEERSEVLAQIGDAEVAFVPEFDAELLAAAPKLRWLHMAVGGVERALFPELIASPVQMTCLKTSFGIPGGEYALGIMLAISRRIIYDVRQRERDREGFVYDDGFELQGKTLGIIGLGNMGSEIAARAHCFGMRVIGLARQPRACPAYLDQLYPTEELPAMLGAADFIAVAVPSTPATRGMIDATVLHAMKPTAYLIDVSGRPALYDLAALEQALREGWIAGASLSTSLPADSPLWELDNLHISFHRATSRELMDRLVDQFCENLRRYHQGLPLLGLVDKQAGY